MIKKILIASTVIAGFFITWSSGETATNNIIDNRIISPGDITISQVSNAKVDWVTLHNNLDHDVNIGGFVFTDGDNIFTFEKETVIAAGGDIRIASSKDEGEIDVNVDYYWGDWGLSKDGELATLINGTGDMVVDFVFAQPLDDGQILERNPYGTGPLMDSRKVQPMQMQRPTYRAIPTETISDLGKHFSTSVISLGGLLTGISTFLLNINQIRDALSNFGLLAKRED